jgi:hypothetical protein
MVVMLQVTDKHNISEEQAVRDTPLKHSVSSWEPDIGTPRDHVTSWTGPVCAGMSLRGVARLVLMTISGLSSRTV